jgi:hypothetical protein
MLPFGPWHGLYITPLALCATCAFVLAAMPGGGFAVFSESRTRSEFNFIKEGAIRFPEGVYVVKANQSAASGAAGAVARPAAKN